MLIAYRDDHFSKEAQYQAHLNEALAKNEELEKSLSQLKSKHFDKLDLIRRAADLEARITFLTAEKDVAVKERNRNELDHSKLKRENQKLAT